MADLTEPPLQPPPSQEAFQASRPGGLRLLPRTLAALLLVPCAPVIGVLGLGVALSMGRPVLFRQERSGLHQARFTLLKLRSMRSAFDAAGAPLPDEARVTGLGKFLRRSRLDELPGLWNVVRGDMAFVGPRPLLPETIAQLGERGRQRARVRPGLTGWSQVNGNTLLSLDEKVALDMCYIDNASPRLDMQILLRTFWVMLGGERRAPQIETPRVETCPSDAAE
ncbi:sugar transferase [Novosphingobium mangrovi (ex Hu et al. 2023)]|uniref:Sugar transferase n=1 Tax=Novosphingobium mangrovi (ex Hu et al. 2023) TaxID=2930094 RepID=A0ABT0ABY0_9SPHN|nr:sugar transferase [Novosphingobium mangrovi (ex Hu et al. 2023)]MCJ1960707.1 sugar transferase [Novosphingobium mangrovi (ex Hu et al. 2023)]